MFEVVDLGLTSYEDAEQCMRTFHTQKLSHPCTPDRLLVTHHLPVVTMGLRPQPNELCVDECVLASQGIHFCKTDRGGSVTAHEPGQLILYPVFSLKHDQRPSWGVKRLVWTLEEAMIRTVAAWGIEAQRDDAHPGVWVGTNKLGAIGLRVEKNITRHGVALNVVNDLSTFRFIVPCGIKKRWVTSVAQEIQYSGDSHALFLGIRNHIIRVLQELY